MTTTPPPLTGQDIGEAQRAVHALLIELLAAKDRTYPDWIALRTLTQDGPVIGRDELRRLLAERLDAEPPAVVALLDRLGSTGLIRDAGDPPAVELTPAGAALYQALLADVAQATARIYADLDPADLATTRRVLHHVTERATEPR